MNDILIFATGASFGALVVCFSVCAAIVASGKLTRNPQQSEQLSIKGKTGEEEDMTEEQERMKKQFENLFNYNGTTEGQNKI